MNSTIQTTISFLLLTLKFKMKCLNVILLLLASPFCDSNYYHLQSRIIIILFNFILFKSFIIIVYLFIILFSYRNVGHS